MGEYICWVLNCWQDCPAQAVCSSASPVLYSRMELSINGNAYGIKVHAKTHSRTLIVWFVAGYTKRWIDWIAWIVADADAELVFHPLYHRYTYLNSLLQ